MKNILITGGAGFIGSHLVKHFVRKYPDYRIINIDALTYAGNLENISEIESFSNYIFEQVDIRDIKTLHTIFSNR
jgi:dTDP-glucose 4,6-dehydratase